jgi:Tfp pilus assembly protein PilV
MYTDTMTHQRGSSLIEILIAVTIMALVLVSIAAALTYSVKSTAEARYRDFAAGFAQEGMEVYRRERIVQGWESFYENIDDGSYCLNDLPTDTATFQALAQGGCGQGEEYIGQEFEREAIVDVIDADTVNVKVNVSWPGEDTVRREVEVEQRFTNYE